MRVRVSCCLTRCAATLRCAVDDRDRSTATATAVTAADAAAAVGAAAGATTDGGRTWHCRLKTTSTRLEMTVVTAAIVAAA